MMDTPTVTTSAGNTITLRIELPNRSGMLGRVSTAIDEAGGNIVGIDLIRAGRHAVTRDITLETGGLHHTRQIVDVLEAMDGVTVEHVSDRTFLLHLGGKIEVVSKTKVDTRAQLSMAYTPGVARVCQAISERPEDVYSLTVKGNMVAVVTDGTAVLGLGDIGPHAALPVMEGKAMLFKDFGGVNAFPVCLDTRDVNEIVRTVEAIAPAFGGINLEDISAPRCFEIEQRLKQSLDIPVFHDDQHGTAVVTTAAVINALRVVGKRAADIKVVVSGIGAAGTSCTLMLKQLGVRNVVGCDSQGVVHQGRTDLNRAKADYASVTNPEGLTGSIHEAMEGADLFLGLSVPGVINVDDLKRMANDPIVFALANPVPEIAPEEAWPHVAVMATGRSDYPNQINNVLCFPGLFRGALACRARQINEEMKMAAALAIAQTVEPEALSADYVIPSVFNRAVAQSVADAVAEAAMQTGAARRTRN